jgi:hypothetical protein
MEKKKKKNIQWPWPVLPFSLLPSPPAAAVAPVDGVRLRYYSIHTLVFFLSIYFFERRVKVKHPRHTWRPKRWWYFYFPPPSRKNTHPHGILSLSCVRNININQKYKAEQCIYSLSRWRHWENVCVRYFSFVFYNMIKCVFFFRLFTIHGHVVPSVRPAALGIANHLITMGATIWCKRGAD